MHGSMARNEGTKKSSAWRASLKEGDTERDDYCTNLQNRDKERDGLGGALQTIETGADSVIGPSAPRNIAHNFGVQSTMCAMTSGEPAYCAQ
jgi:hypothetical protein